MNSCPSHSPTAVADPWVGRLDPAHPDQNAALEELRHFLCAFLIRALGAPGGADHFFIEDMTQESLLKIVNRLHTFTGRSRFTTWACSIAIRTALSERRRRQWGDISLDALHENGNHPEPEDTESPAPQHTVKEELHGKVLNLIKTRLTPAQRDVLLAELNGMPQDEIARQTGRTRNAVYKLFHDARRALRKELELEGITAAILAEVYA